MAWFQGFEFRVRGLEFRGSSVSWLRNFRAPAVRCSIVLQGVLLDLRVIKKKKMGAVRFNEAQQLQSLAHDADLELPPDRFPRQS